MKSVYEVLLVEDSDTDAFFFSLAINEEKKLHLVGRAHDGNDAIAYLSGRGQYADRHHYPYPDVIVLDLNMPGLDGFDVLEWLGKQPNRPRVCVYTSSNEPENIKRAMALGADCFLAKAIDPHQMSDVFMAVQGACTRPL